MNADTQGPTSKDQDEGLTPRDRLALRFERMDKELKNPNLIPDERYAIVAPFVHWIE